jgi:hypothetical protein|tara:strand:- start:80 stop:271 length:192 start_codon:yes stop_codon:yes gene_type:complete
MYYILYGLRIIAICADEDDAYHMLVCIAKQPIMWSVPIAHKEHLEVKLIPSKTLMFIDDIELA